MPLKFNNKCQILPAQSYSYRRNETAVCCFNDVDDDSKNYISSDTQAQFVLDSNIIGRKHHYY